ncbi:MAG: hypothetical protein ABI175_07295 [Polyangiales bacterium]
MGSGGGALVVVLALTSVARADDFSLYERLWPSVPSSRQATLGQQFTDTLSELGNQLGYHLDQLSNDTLEMKFDARNRKARVKFGLFDSEYATFTFDSLIRFQDGLAKIDARLCVGIAGRVMHIDLPEVEMLPTEYHGERGIQLRLPLYRRYF